MKESEPIQKEFGEVKILGNRIEIRRFGSEEVVGTADFYKRDEPLPHYVLLSVDVIPEERGKGFASQLMSEAEHISKESGKPMVLYDAMTLPYENQNYKAFGMYRKRPGWTRIRDPNGKATGYYVYGSNDPEFFSQILKQAEQDWK